MKTYVVEIEVHIHRRTKILVHAEYGKMAEEIAERACAQLPDNFEWQEDDAPPVALSSLEIKA